MWPVGTITLTAALPDGRPLAVTITIGPGTADTTARTADTTRTTADEG